MRVNTYIDGAALSRSFATAVVVLSLCASAQAAKVVVMNIATHATNSVIPAGQDVVTFGIQVSQADLVGASPGSVLIVQDLTFAGNGIVPINGTTGATNKVDVQGVQSSIVDPIVDNFGRPATPADLSPSAQQALYADSWWYNGGTGFLYGAIDPAGDTGIVTDPAYQLGPIGNVGPTGMMWIAGGSGLQAGDTVPEALASVNGANAKTGQFMIYSGVFGGIFENHLLNSPLADEFVNGVLTVPIAQIVTTGNIQIPGSSSNAGGGQPGVPGTGTFIGVVGVGTISNGPTGNGTFNVAGGNPTIDPGLYFDFAKGQLVPEPGTIVLSIFSVCGFVIAARMSRKMPANRVA